MHLRRSDGLRTSSSAVPTTGVAASPAVPLPPSPMAGFTGTVPNRTASPVVYSRKPQAITRTDPVLMKPPAAAVTSPVMMNSSAAAIAALNSANAAFAQRVVAKPEDRKVAFYSLA